MINRSLTVAVAFASLSLNVHALKLENVRVDSYLGESLDLSMVIRSIDSNQYSTMQISLAPRDIFAGAGLQYPDNSHDMHIELGAYDNGEAILRLRTGDAINEPYLQLILQFAWSGGKMMRALNVLVDPADYPIGPAISSGTLKLESKTDVPVVASAAKPQTGSFHIVEEGETISSIAAQYRPMDTMPQQAWIAFYKLNKKAFPDGNLNRIITGTRLKIPSAAQMRAVLHSDALLEVKRLSRPLDANLDFNMTTIGSPTREGLG